MANQSQVLYNNALTSGGTVSYSGTETDGFNKENLYDYKDFSKFKPEVSTTSSLDFVIDDGFTSLNSWGVYMEKTGNSGTCTITLEYESAPATFTSLDSITSADGDLCLCTFSSVDVVAGRKIRIHFDLGAGPFYVRQIMAGSLTTFERGQYSGVNPPTLTQGIIQSNNISENGSILGTNVKRVDVKSSIDLTYLTESWVRNTWDSFAFHASKGRGFFYLWNPSEYPDEAVYCVASKINPPKNITPTPLMSVSMPIICRQPDL